MDYSTIASSIKQVAESLATETKKIKSSPFDDIWKGSAHDKLISDLSSSITKIKTQRNAANRFADALEKIETYKKNNLKKETLYKQYNRIVDTDETREANRVKRKNIKGQIENLNYVNNSLKISINKLLNSITSVNSELSVVKYDPLETEDYKEYVVNINEFLMKFNSGNLKTFGTSSNSSSLYDYYTSEEIDSKMEEIKTQFSGRDAAVNCALGVMEMAASVGGKLNLGWGMTENNSSSDVIIGNEYTSFASWAVNQGCDTNNLTASTILDASSNTSYELAQRGDILVSNSGSMIMIVDNNSETQEFLVAEVSNPEDGVVVQARSYASLTGNYQAMDLSSIYND